MTVRASAARSAEPPRGILRKHVLDGSTEHRRILPNAALAPFVAHFWSVRWVLRAPFTVETLPHPSVHLVFEWGPGLPERAEVGGVHTGRFSKQLVGEGRVFGIKFRPAAFQRLLHAPVASLTDRVVPLEAVFGRDANVLTQAILGAPDLTTAIAFAEAFLTPRLPPLPKEIERLRDLVERMATDRSLLRAEDTAAIVGLDLRTLQRRFRQYVGVSPKWVLQRYRLHEAAERLKGANPPPLAGLAAELGYFDQSHFVRDFKIVVGRTPGLFAAMEGGRNVAPGNRV